MPCAWISGNEEQQAGASPLRVWGMPSPAEPVKPVSQPSRASRSEMYSLWSRDGAVRGGCGRRRGAAPRGCGGLLPYHVGIRGGHDVGVGAVGPHGDPQRGQTRRRVGGRRRQVLVAQGDVLGLGGTPCRGSREQGGGAGRGSPVGPRSSPGCHSWWKEPVAPTVQHSLWARRHPGASGCSLGACWPFAPARNRTRQLRPRPQPQMPASPALGILQNPVFLAPGIVGENQRHPLVQEELNLPVPMAQWDHHGMVPSTEHGGAARSLPGASQRWGRARSWLTVGLCLASPQGCLARGPTTTPWALHHQLAPGFSPWPRAHGLGPWNNSGWGHHQREGPWVPGLCTLGGCS